MPNQISGDAASPRKPEDYYDQMPRWIWHSTQFNSKAFGGIEAKLIIYLIGRQNRFTNIVPLLGPTDLTRAIGPNRNRMKQAIENLTLCGFIVSKQNGRKFSIKINSHDPRSHVKGAGFATEDNDPLLSAEVKKLSSPSEFGNNKLRSAPGEMADTAINNGGVSDPNDPFYVPDPAGAVHSKTESKVMVYEPGLDPELFPGRTIV